MLKEGCGAQVEFKENPRKELAENELEVSNEGLVSLGFEPVTLGQSLIDDVSFIADNSRERFKSSNVMTSPKW